MLPAELRTVLKTSGFLAEPYRTNTVKSTEMSEQQSQKRGVISEAQKTTKARHGYEPIPPTNPVAGAHGKHHKDIQTDHDLALSTAERSTNKPDKTAADSRQPE